MEKIKGWAIIFEDEYLIRYQNKKIKSKTVEVYALIDVKDYNKKLWSVALLSETSIKDIPRKYWSSGSKKEALKYAKDYMEKYPRG